MEICSLKDGSECAFGDEGFQFAMEGVFKIAMEGHFEGMGRPQMVGVN